MNKVDDDLFMGGCIIPFLSLIFGISLIYIWQASGNLFAFSLGIGSLTISLVIWGPVLLYFLLCILEMLSKVLLDLFMILPRATKETWQMIRDA